MFLSKLNQILLSEKSFISQPLNLIPIGLSLLINIIHWGLLGIKIGAGSSDIVLHYNVTYGANLIDAGRMIYAIPAVALLILIINVLLAWYFFKREKLGSFFINFATIAVQAIFLIASINLILIND